MMPRLDWKPVEKVTAPSLWTKSANSRSSSRWSRSVPFKKREPEQPVPYSASAASAAAITSGAAVRPR